LLNGSIERRELADFTSEIKSDFTRLHYNRDDISKRLILHTQTSHRIPNTLSSVAKKGEDDTVLAGTPNHRELIRILLSQKAKTLGESFDMADREVQTYRNLDAEIFLGVSHR
jgi:predicted transcriptional regulator